MKRLARYWLHLNVVMDKGEHKWKNIFGELKKTTIYAKWV